LTKNGKRRKQPQREEGGGGESSRFMVNALFAATQEIQGKKGGDRFGGKEAGMTMKKKKEAWRGDWRKGRARTLTMDLNPEKKKRGKSVWQVHKGQQDT